MPRIWGFGSAAIDIRIKTADYGEQYRDKLLAQEIVWLGGGSAANFLVQVSRLGGKAGWLGKLGTDRISREIENSFITEQIDVRAIIHDPDCVSPFNLAVYAGDNRRRVGGFLLPNSLRDMTVDDLSYCKTFLVPNDWLLIEVGEIPIKTCLLFSAMARSNDVRIVLDIDLDPVFQCRASRNEIDRLFTSVDMLMPNKSSMLTMFGALATEELLEKLWENYGIPAIVSEGDQGSSCIDMSGGIYHTPAIDIDVMDTVGAGDAFHGGVVYALARGYGFQKAMELGTICATHNCRTFGAREGMLRAHELESYGFLWGDVH